MELQKRVAAIHDISGFGKCSLTVILPIISAAGIETSVLPTAVLSTHTGGLPGYTCHDLTEDLLPAARHWKSLDLSFHALYSGFLASYEQIDVVSQIFDLLKSEETLIMVDPVLADNGRFYASCTSKMAAGMAELCKKADILIPNLTEAAFLLGREFYDGPYDREYIEDLLIQLSHLGPKKVVLTGVWFSPQELGAAGYDSETGQFSYAFSSRIQGFYHGTGDIFGSVLLSAQLKGMSLDDSLQLAVEFTHCCIDRTHSAGTDPRHGVNFESLLPMLIHRLQEL